MMSALMLSIWVIRELMYLGAGKYIFHYAAKKNVTVELLVGVAR
jgi:hypothetical protein